MAKPKRAISKSSILIRNGTVLTLGREGRIIENASVLITGDSISKIGSAKEVKAPKSARVIDARGKLIMPGWINTHMHFYSTFARGLTKVKPSANFNEVLENLWWKLDRKLTLEDCMVSAEVALVEAIRKGTTTLIDHHASPGAVRGSLEAIAKAVRTSGLRACLCYEVSDRDGAAVTAEGMAENWQFIRQAKRAKDPLVRALYGLHASFTLSDATLKKAADAASELGCGVHIHVAEAKSDQDSCQAEHGIRVVERLAKFGALGKNTIAAHCVHMNEHELDLLASSGTAVVHNPQSNMNNAVGIADVVAMAGKGITVGLGTDAMTVDMVQELRAGVWAQHLRAGNPSLGFGELVQALTVQNAVIADRIWDGIGLGKLEEGSAADVILVDYDPPTPLGSDNWAGHLVFGLASAPVDTTIVAGKVLMHRKKLEIKIDEERLSARARELAEALWTRL